MSDKRMKVTIYLTEEQITALRDEHARTYPEHRLRWLAWVAQRLMATLG